MEDFKQDIKFWFESLDYEVIGSGEDSIYGDKKVVSDHDIEELIKRLDVLLGVNE